MATAVFEGQATAVAQVEIFQVTTYDVGGTYVLTVGISPYTFVISVPGDTDEDTTATNLAAAWNGAVHPYCTRITATVSTDTVTLTADVPGVPFTVTGSASGGAAAMGAGTVTVDSEGPNHFMLAVNWQGSTPPSSGDLIIVSPDAPNICWDLDIGLGATSSLWLPEGSYKCGLRSDVFAISADGENVDESKPEYRETYLKGLFALVTIGQQDGPSLVASPSTRIKVENTDTAAGTTYIQSARGTSAESGKPTIRLKYGDDTDHVLIINSALGGVGVAIEDETSDLASLIIQAASTGTWVMTGRRVQVVLFEQDGGTCVLRSKATITTGTLHSGILTTQDGTIAFKFTTFTQNGGVANMRHGDGSNIVATTYNGNAGTLDLSMAKPSATITTLNPQPGFLIKNLPDGATITTTNKATGPHTITWS